MAFLYTSLLSAATLMSVKGFDSGATSECLQRINHLRSKWHLRPMTEREDLHSCVNKQAEYDKQHGAHAAFGLCGSRGQAEGGLVKTCTEVIDMFYNERWKCSAAAAKGSPFKSMNIANEHGCMEACNSDSECLSFDYMTTSKSDSCRFFKQSHFTESELQDGTENRVYCSAGPSAACSGHCGLVMDQKHLDIAWGSFDGYWTVNNNNPPKITGGQPCPAGDSTWSRCYTDKAGVLWVHGEREDCQRQCEFAGATFAEFSCDAASLPADYSATSALLSHFGYKCQPGQCWNGKSPVNAVAMSVNGKCYVPNNPKQKFDCKASLGNANCYGDRMSMLCPCRKNRQAPFNVTKVGEVLV